MNKNPIVSIITPCYNGEKHVHRFLDSILAQTYSNIELIFINDGSTDNTEGVVFSYKDRLLEKDIKLIYVYQENKGLGGAINAGLKKVTGKYLCWPDADDYLEPESVELRLEILEKNPEYTVVTSDAFIRSINDLQKPIDLVSANYNTNEDTNQFMHLLNGKSIFCSGSHMIRTKEFFETHPSGEIFPSRRGQNYQMLLPVYYFHKRYFLNKPLYNYIRYSTSLSQIEDINCKEKIVTYNSQKVILLETLSAMDIAEKEKIYFKKLINTRYSRINFSIAYDYLEYELLKKEYQNLKILNQLTYKIKIRFIIAEIKKIMSPWFKRQYSSMQ